MADTPITNCYITTRELALAYFAGDPRAAAFIATPATMDWYLKRATKIIDNLPLKGTTYYEFTSDTTPDADEQNKQFPRVIDRIVYDWDDDTTLPYVPQAVLDACCEIALSLYLFYADSDRVDRKTMAEDGVQNYNLGGVYAETLGRSNMDKHKGLISSEAYELLKGYIAGAVEITF